MGEKLLEVLIGVDKDLDLPLARSPHPARAPRAEGNDERLPMDTQSVGDLEDPLDMREGDFFHRHGTMRILRG